VARLTTPGPRFLSCRRRETLKIADRGRRSAIPRRPSFLAAARRYPRTSSENVNGKTTGPDGRARVPPGAHHATPFQPEGSSKPYLRARGFFNLSTWIIAIAGAAILLLAYHLIISRSAGRSRSGRSRRWAHR
jgi:hypothetical protein